MNNAAVFRPITDPEQWREFLAQPKLHWQKGYSARTLAHCWQTGAACERGQPADIRTAIDANERLRGMEVLIALPEHKVALPGGRRASQTDLWLLGRTDRELVSVAIEGKAREDFGPLVRDWLANAAEGSGKQERLSAIRNVLNILPSTNLEGVRYQLLHRTASAVLEARRFHAGAALMLVHAFGADSHFDQFATFGRVLGAEIPAPGIAPVAGPAPIALFLGWVGGDDLWLKA